MGEEQVNIWASIARSSNPDWGLESIQQVYDVIAAVGIDQSDERIRFDQHVHGLHPVTFLGAWIYVPYSQESIGCVLTKEHSDRLRREHGADNLMHGGSMYHGLEWAVINGRNVPAQSIQDGLAGALRVLGKATDEWNTFTYHEHQELGESLILLWNPDRWSWSTISNDVVRIDERGYHIESWKVSSASRIRVGMPCFVLRTSKDPRGIIASGVVVSPPHETEAFDNTEETQMSVVVRLDTILDPRQDVILSSDILRSHPTLSDVFASPIRSSGRVLSNGHTQELVGLWKKHVEVIRGVQYGENLPDSSAEAFYSEGASRQLSVNRYERSGSAREEAIRIHGTTCAVCSMSFKHVYGAIGEGFIHVHHIRPISDFGQQHRVDPAADLVPVCPNCHVMLHRRTPPYSVEELRALIV